MKLTAEEALTALRALYRTPAYRNQSVIDAGNFVKAVGVVPPWLAEMTAQTNKWQVYHEGAVYETTARSRADAINNIRYNLYGETPADALPPFDAVNPAFVIMDAIGANRRREDAAAPRDLFGRKTISKADALARIRRMAS